MRQESPGGGQGVPAAGADGGHALARLDHVARATDEQEVLTIGGDQHRLQSAQEPAKPASTRPPCSRRIFWSSLFMTTLPSVTWPSPPTATLPWCRTARM